MARISQWETALGNWIEWAQHRHFMWGEFDCALMVASCAEAITGVHPAPDLVGAYYTPLGAARILKRNGGLSGLCDDRWKRTDQPQRGDISLGKFGEKESLMINYGNCFMVTTTHKPALLNKAEVNAIASWRVE